MAVRGRDNEERRTRPRNDDNDRGRSRERGNSRERDDDRGRDARPKMRSSSKSRFQYKERTYESMQRRSERSGGGFESPFLPQFDMWRPKVGDNYIRILPQTWDDPDNYFGYKVWVHAWVGADNATYCCPRKMNDEPCPICEAAKEAQAHGDDEKEIKGLKVAENYAYWIIDRDADDPKPKPKLYLVGWMRDRDLAALLVDKRTKKSLAIDDPYNGFDVTIKRTGAGLQTRYQPVIDHDSTALDKKDSVIDEVLDYIQDNPIPSTLKFYDADHLEKVISGTNAERDDDLDDDDHDGGRQSESENEGREARSSNKRTRRASREEDVVEEGEEDAPYDDNGEEIEEGTEEEVGDEGELADEGGDEGGEEIEEEVVEDEPPRRERTRGREREREAPPKKRTEPVPRHASRVRKREAAPKPRSERERSSGRSVSSGRRQFRD